MEHSKVNSQGITRVKCLATILVVLIHVVALPVNDYGKADSLAYWSTYSLGHLGVPLFVMCSGALLLQEKYGNWQQKGEIKRRTLRILVPLLVYGWVYAMVKLVFTYKTVTLRLFLQALIQVIMGDSWAHLWYLYMLLGLYLLLPCIRHLYWGTSESQKSGIFAVLLAFGTVLPVVARLFGVAYSGANLLTWCFPASICYVLYFLTGALLVRPNQLKKIEKYLDVAGISGLLILTLWPFIVKDISLKNAILGYDSVFIWLSAAWIFSRIYENCNLYFKVFASFERFSFGVYLIHPFFMNLMYKAVNFTPLFGSGLLTIPLFTFLFLAFSLACAWCISKIPVANQWLI